MQEFKSGSRVTVRGLTSAAGMRFNGTEATVECWRDDISRLQLRCDGGENLALKLENVASAPVPVPLPADPTLQMSHEELRALVLEQQEQLSELRGLVRVLLAGDGTGTGPGTGAGTGARTAAPPVAPSAPPPPPPPPDAVSGATPSADIDDDDEEGNDDLPPWLMAAAEHLQALHGPAVAKPPPSSWTSAASETASLVPTAFPPAPAAAGGAAAAAPTARTSEAACALEQAAWASQEALDLWAHQQGKGRLDDAEAAREREAEAARERQRRAAADQKEVLRRARQGWAALDMAARNELEGRHGHGGHSSAAGRRRPLQL